MKKLFFIILCLFIQPAIADRLLVISSGLGMYGSSNALNTGVERFGANLVEEALKHKYEKVYKIVTNEHKEEGYYYATREFRLPAIQNTIDQILKDIKEGERLDVFTMQHGPDGTPFDGLYVHHANIPHGLIRNVYSTACNEFGDATIRSSKDVEVTAYDSTFSDALEAIGVENYLYHVNMNGTGGFSLALLLKEFAKTDDWAKAGKIAFADFDREMAKLIPGIQGLRNNETIAKIMPDFNGMTRGWEDIVNSRLVIGTKNKNKSVMSSSLKSDTFNIQGNNGYFKDIVHMQPELEEVVSEYCVDGFSDGANCSQVAPEMKLTDAVKVFLERFSFVFDQYDSSENACLPGAVVNGLTSAMDLGIKFKELCFRKKNDNKYKLVWKLHKDHLLDFKKEVELPIDEIRRINIATRGEILIKIVRDSKIKIRLRGIKILINGFDGEGKLKGFSKFRPSGINIYESGRIEGRVKVLGIPLTGGVEDKTIDEIDMIDFFKLFGFRVYLEKLGINL